jgi:uncharacterized protein (DUF1800 family)
MRTLLLSDEFRAGDAIAQRLLVRQPAEVMVASAKAFGVSLDNDDAVLQLRNMGQNLFVPPNVGGFASGMQWLSPSTVVARYGWAATLGGKNLGGLPASTDTDGWARRVGLGALTPETSAALHAYVAQNTKLPETNRQTGMLTLLLTSPDWMAL